jgi:3-deoxy-D-manno-octulosonate 8-phosphate phosphatase (KDO 8-P phosphatase)
MENRLQKIKAFVFDVDGVLTDGGILATPEGDLLRVFDSKDSFALRMAYMKGYHVGIITGGVSESIRLRFRTCGVAPENIYLGSRAKIEDFEDFCSRHDIQPDEVMYFGDDLPDIPVMLACGCGVSPADAVEEVKAAADHVSSRPGGKGVAREMIEAVLKMHGKWELDVHDYKSKF